VVFADEGVEVFADELAVLGFVRAVAVGVAGDGGAEAEVVADLLDADLAGEGFAVGVGEAEGEIALADAFDACVGLVAPVVAGEGEASCGDFSDCRWSVRSSRYS